MTYIPVVTVAQTSRYAVNQVVATPLDLTVDGPQLAGRERRAELGAHGVPPLALHEEQVVGERVGPQVGVEPVVGEVRRRVADQHAARQLRVADHQERRPHLIEPAVPVPGQPVVDGLVRVHRVLGADGHAPKVAEQRRGGARVRHAEFFPVPQRPRAIAISYHAEKQQRPPGGRLPRRYAADRVLSHYLDQNDVVVSSG